MNAPLRWHWDGESMVPRSPRFADKQFVVGEDYWLEAVELRSMPSHRHYFASIREAWMNLPDELAMEFPTPEKLRKRALINAGFYDERRFSAASPKEARAFAAFLEPVDEFAVISVAGNIVIERKAKSQSVRSMGAKTFRESKDAVLDTIAKMIGVEPVALSANAGQAA